MISVVVPSFNGASVLPMTLDSLARVEREGLEVQFVLVDNRSSDGSGALMKAFADAHGGVALTESRPGKSYALNQALDRCEGELVAFADDDVIFDAGWLRAWVRAARAHPDASVFAGQVRHHWMKAPPRWLVQLADDGYAYAGTPVDTPEGSVYPAFLRGPNFMIRAEVARRVRFDEGDGVNFAGQGTSRGGEDTKFAFDATGAGFKLVYVPDARVEHIVRSHEVGVRAVLRRYRRIGQAREALEERHVGDRRLAGVPMGTVGVLPRLGAAAAFHALRGDPHRAILSLMFAAQSVGRADYWRSRRE